MVKRKKQKSRKPKSRKPKSRKRGGKPWTAEARIKRGLRKTGRAAGKVLSRL